MAHPYRDKARRNEPGWLRKADGGPILSPRFEMKPEPDYGPKGKYGLDLTVPVAKNTDVFGQASVSPFMDGPNRPLSDLQGKIGIRQRFKRGGRLEGKKNG